MSWTNLAVALSALALTEINAEAPAQFPLVTGSRGCLIERITDGDYDQFQHQGVSHDGRWLSVGWRRGQDEQDQPVRGASIMDLHSGETRLLADPLNHNSSFSPDAALLVGAQYTADGKTEIIEYEISTAAARVIAPDPGWDFLPSYSPDGRTIAFNSYRSGDSEIYLYDRATQSLERLTHAEGYDAHAEFSPDGRRLSFHRQIGTRADGGYDFDIYVIDLATRTETRLIDTPYEDGYAAWAPDGQAIVYSSDVQSPPGKPDLYVRTPAGDTIQLTHGEFKDSYAYWMRDGGYIYFNSDRGGTDHIYRMKMNGLDCARAHRDGPDEED